MGRASAAHDLGSGLSSLDSLASYDPESCSWKTSQRSLEGGFCEFSETLPRSGMMRNGGLYPLPNAERHMSESASLSWGTCRASGGAGNAAKRAARGMLEGQVALVMGLERCPALNPRWCLALMGFPLEWLDGLPDRENRSSIGSRRGQPKKPKSEVPSSKPSGTL
jgi:hypothetical protein